MNAAWHRTLTVITAPAGYGKTALLRCWADRQPQPIGWLRLDSGDDELRRFLFYFLHRLPIPSDEELRKWSERICESDAESLSLQLESLAAEWVALLERVEKPQMLILDSFESIRNPDIVRFLAIFFRYSPPHLHAIVSGRQIADIGFPMYEDGEGGSFVAEDLVLTDHELYLYILKRTSIRLSKSEIGEFKQRTQGWFVGVNAYVPLIRTQGYKYGEPEYHSRAEHDIATFFRSLIHAENRPELLLALMNVSAAGQLGEGLARQLMEDVSPRITLAVLSREGWFLFPVHHQPGYFVFHPMFTAFLQRELRDSSEEAYSAMKWKCALHAEESKEYIQAVEHALDAGFRDQAAELVLRYAPELMRISHLKQLLERFTKAELTMYPELAVMLANSLIHARQIHVAEQVLGLLNAVVADKPQAILASTNEPLNGYLAALHSMIHFSRSETELGLLFTQQAAELLGGPGQLHRHSLYFQPYTASLLRGKYGHYGVLKSAIATCEFCMPRWGQKDTAYAVMLICMGECLYEEERLDESEPYLWEGLKLSVDLDNSGLFVPAYVAWAQLKYGKGEKEAAWATLRQARNQLIHRNLEAQLAVVDACESKLRMKEQDIRYVRKWMRTTAVLSLFTIPQERMFEAFVLLRAYIFIGKTSEALTFGESLLQAALTVNHPRDLIESHLLLAQIYRKQGKVDKAVEKMLHAVSEAHAQGYIHMIMDEGAALTDLLTACRKRSRLLGNSGLDEFVTILLKAMPKEGKTNVANLSPTAMLTRQEQRIFQLLIEGASNRTIADVLAITMETAKRHCRHVYHKLGVANRKQVVQQFSKKTLG
ncbi:LuxR C-terminal-related transcriptional regulator [Paenibacillus koleovorans]|uniref:LuxR C-terminal-related transcriptional regulator n=1 Tax=Paenibacillus koleovorans TaxID=121608 RepID=UPI0013E28E0D|nr:LuxR C-terminal-related transcriptional regulator [Paenibacillus koleovorans]